MAAIAHGYAEQTTQQTHTGNTNWTTKVTVAASNFVAGGVYLILCTAQVGGSSASARFGFRLAHGTTPTAFAESEMILEPRATGATASHDYSCALVFTQPGTAEDIVFQVQTPTSAANTARADSIALWWMRLDASLSTPADYVYDTDTSATTHTTSFQDFATVTITSAASENWLVIAGVRFDVNVITNQCQYRINRDSGTETVPSWGFESEEATEQHVHMLVRAYTLSSGSHTFTVQGRDAASAGNAHSHSFIIAIRMPAFKDSGFFWNAAATATTSFTEVANVDITPSVAADFLILAASHADPNSTGFTFQQRIQVGGTTEPAGSDGNDSANSNDAGNDTAIPMAILTQETFSTAAQDIDYDVSGIGEAGKQTLNRSLVVLSMELDQVAGAALSATSAGTSTADAGALQLNHALSATISGSATATASFLSLPRALSATSAGTSTAAAEALRLTHPLSATVAGSSTVSAGTLGSFIFLVAAPAGTSSATAGGLTLTSPLAASAAGVATVSAAALVLDHPLAAMAAGTSTVAASRLSLNHALGAVAAGVASVTAGLTVDIPPQPLPSATVTLRSLPGVTVTLRAIPAAGVMLQVVPVADVTMRTIPVATVTELV